MRLWPFSSELLVAVVASAVVSACIIALFDTPPRSSAVDDWRRTASGWERSGHWRAAALPSANHARSQHAPARRRYDTHPAVIALLQLTAALLALSAFPARRQSAEATPIAWPTQIARSFRASAFGS